MPFRNDVKYASSTPVNEYDRMSEAKVLASPADLEYLFYGEPQRKSFCGSPGWALKDFCPERDVHGRFWERGVKLFFSCKRTNRTFSIFWTSLSPCRNSSRL